MEKVGFRRHLLNRGYNGGKSTSGRYCSFIKIKEFFIIKTMIMRKMNESLLRSYIRGVLVEANLLTPDVFIPLRGILDPLKSVIKNIDEYEKSGKLEPHEAYKFSLKIHRGFFSDVVEKNLKKFLGDSDDWARIVGFISWGIKIAFDSNISDEFNEDQISFHLNNIINSGEQNVIDKFSEGIKKSAEKIRSMAEIEAKKLNLELIDFYAGLKSRKESSDQALVPLVKKFDDVVNIAASKILEDPMVLNLFRNFISSTSSAGGFRERMSKKADYFDVFIEFARPVSRLKKWTHDNLVKALKDEFDSRMKKLNLSKEDLESEANAIILILKSVPDMMDSIKDEINSDKKKISKAAEAPKDAPLGRIAFAPSRKKKPFEENTEEEEALLQKLIRHFGGTPLDAASFKRIQEIMKNDWYKSMFKEPKAEIVYRGISINKDWLDKLIKGGISDEESGSIDVNANIGRDNYASSWSTKKSVANHFGVHGSFGMADYSAVMHAKVADNRNKLLDCKGLYEVYELEGYKEESEVMCFGPAKIFKVEWKKINISDVVDRMDI